MNECDRDLCLCGFSNPLSDDYQPCACPCRDCESRRLTLWALKRRHDLEERMKKAGIDMDDFADLMWMRIEATIEARIRKMAASAIKEMLNGVTLYSQIKGVKVP